jgi:hypothetical protein
VLRGTQVPTGSQLAFAYGAVTPYGQPSQVVRLASWFVTPRCVGSTPGGSFNPASDIGLPPTKSEWFGLIRVRSPLLAESLRFPFLRVLRCFSSPGSLLASYGFRCGSPGITLAGLPHSEIHGSKPAGGSPWLIAAIHVLHRPSVPRHPPCALNSSASRSLDPPSRQDQLPHISDEPYCMLVRTLLDYSCVVYVLSQILEDLWSDAHLLFRSAADHQFSRA